MSIREPNPRKDDPYRNLASDIIHLALDDLLSKAAVNELLLKNNSKSKEQLTRHGKALYYFRMRQFTVLSELLGLEPEPLVKAAFQRVK